MTGSDPKVDSLGSDSGPVFAVVAAASAVFVHRLDCRVVAVHRREDKVAYSVIAADFAELAEVVKVHLVCCLESTPARPYRRSSGFCDLLCLTTCEMMLVCTAKWDGE
jgi:hypothetical protein